jgi:glucose/arabinose dehydrogenase
MELPDLVGLSYEPIADLPFPVQMVPVPDTPNSLVATKDGRVWVFDGSNIAEQPVLDISDQVHNEGERGLLSITVRSEDPLLYVHYTANDGDTVVSNFRGSVEDGFDPTTETILLRHPQPAPNHNGGMIQFGPDDALYVGLGDGGGGGDQFDNGQNQETLLGGLVRIDVAAEAEPTLYASGLRNPWRFWIDGDTIYIADVGQRAYEEISIGQMEPGANYGWPITEGLHCFRPPSGCEDSTAGHVAPVIEVEHDDAGTCSITGGVVYRGSEIPEIDGHFFYSDYCGGYLRSIIPTQGELVESDWTEHAGVPGRVVGFGLDPAGEMYVMTTEELLKVVPTR